MLGSWQGVNGRKQVESLWTSHLTYVDGIFDTHPKKEWLGTMRCTADHGGAITSIGIAMQPDPKFPHSLSRLWSEAASFPAAANILSNVFLRYFA